MTAAQNTQPLPAQNMPVLYEPGGNFFATIWRNYFAAVDQMFRKAQYGPLTVVATPTNANAAAAGVPLNGMYQSAADPAQVYIRTV